jgi:hypothetical protein
MSLPTFDSKVESNTLDIGELVAEFDAQRRIVHQTAERALHFGTPEQAELLAAATAKNLSRHLGSERGYLITNISKIVIEPTVVDIFVVRINELIAKYLYPHGIARYGYAIGRVTVRMAHESNALEDLNLFATKEEAIAYIERVESNRKEVEAAFTKTH